MSEEEQWTCGKGVAANAVMPELMAQVLDATAGVLENHIRALSAVDPNGKQEIAAYQRVTSDHRAASGQLIDLVRTMRSYRDLPMAEHDMAKLGDAKSIEVLQALVRAQQSLGQLMNERAAEYGAMVEEMKRA
jgi:hypothetical protein